MATTPFKRPTAGSPIVQTEPASEGFLGKFTNVPTTQYSPVQAGRGTYTTAPAFGPTRLTSAREARRPTGGRRGFYPGRRLGKKLWEYGSRYAGRTGGMYSQMSKRLGEYDLGWESPSARAGGPAVGGLRYSRRIRNPIALDTARARARAGSRMPTSIMPGEGPGFSPPGRTPGGTGSLAFMRRFI